MFKDWRFIVVLVVALVAIVVASVEANQLARLKDGEAGLRRDTTACTENVNSLQAELGQMSASLNQLRGDYEALKAEHEKQKGRRGASSKPAPKR